MHSAALHPSIGFDSFDEQNVVAQAESSGLGKSVTENTLFVVPQPTEYSPEKASESEQELLVRQMSACFLAATSAMDQERVRQIEALGLCISPPIPEQEYEKINPLTTLEYLRLKEDIEEFRVCHPNEELPIEIDPDVLRKKAPIALQQAKRTYTLVRDYGEDFIQRVYEAVDRIKFSELLLALNASAVCLNNIFEERKISEYTIGIATNKSNAWIASLIASKLKQLPTNALQLGGGGSTRDLNEVPEHEKISDTTKDTIVFFDDASYSGRQVQSHLVDISQESRARGEHKTVFVIIPFMTERVRDLIKQKYENISVGLITTSRKICTVEEVLSCSDIETLNKIISVEAQKTITYADWKLPDGTSAHEDLYIGRGVLGIIPQVPCPYKAEEHLV